MPQYLPLPDGSSVTIREGETPAQAWYRAQIQYPEAFEPPREEPQGEEGPERGMLSSLVGGAKRMASTGQTALESIIDPEGAARRGVERGQEIGQQYAPGADWDRVAQAYREKGLLSAAGETLSQIPSAVMEQLPQIGVTLGSAKAGALAGTAFGPVGTLIGGGLGAVTPSLLQLYGANVERQAEAQQEAGEELDISRARALGAAVPGAALEAAATLIPFGRAAVGKLLGPEAARYLAAPAGREIVEESLKRVLTKGAVIGTAAEVPTEVTQQMLERLQAGLPLTSDEALAEYGRAAYGATLVGAPVGSAGRVYQRSVARGEKEAEEAEAARVAQEEAARTQAAEQAQYRQSPEYVLDVEQRFNAFNEEVKALRAKANVKVAKDDLAGKAEQREAGQQLSTLIKENKDLINEYNAVKGRLPEIREQQRVGALSPMDYLLEQTGEVQTAEAAPSTALEPSDADLGFVPPAMPGAATSRFVNERIALAQSQLPEPEISDYQAYLMTDRAMAERAVAERPAIEGLSSKEQRQLYDSVDSLLKLQKQAEEKARADKLAEDMAERSELLRAQRQQIPETPDLFAEQQQQVAEDTELQKQRYMEELGFAPYLLERATERGTPVVPVPETVTTIGAKQAQTTRERIEALEAQLQPTITAPTPEGRTAAAEQRQKAAAELSWLSQNATDPYTRELLRVRNEQTAALMDVQDTLDDIRSGTFLGSQRGALQQAIDELNDVDAQIEAAGGSDATGNLTQRRAELQTEIETLRETTTASNAAMGTTTRKLLNRELEEARSRYVKSLLEEAAINRRAAGDTPLTVAEATQAAMEARQTLDELIERGQAAKGSAQGLRYERRPGLDLEGRNLQKAVRQAERRVKQARSLLDELAAEAESGVSRSRQFQLDYERTQAERTLAQRMLDLEAAKRKFAESPKKLVDDVSGWRWGDVRDLEERPFGNYRAAVETQLDQLQQIRQRLNAPTPRQVAPEGLRMQFSETEAQRTAEARGETATTLGGELRRRTEFVRDKMSRMKGMRPQAASALNRAADLMDSGRATRDLLDAVEPVVDTINRGQMPFARDLRAIDEAIKATEPTAREQQEAGQRPLFDEIGDRKQRSEELGYIKKTFADFENSPPMKKARSAVSKARAAEKAFREFLQKAAKQREEQRKSAIQERKAKVDRLQSAISEQRASLKQAEEQAVAEAREAIQAANKAAAEPQLLAAQNALEEARQELTRQEQRLGLFSPEELQRMPEVGTRLKKTIDTKKKELAEAQQALDTLLSELMSNVDAAQLQEATAQDSVLAFERGVLDKLQQTLEEITQQQRGPSEAQVQASQAAAAQRAAVAAAEKRAKDARDAAAEQRRKLQDRMDRGFDLPKFTTEDLGPKRIIRARLDAIENQIEAQDPDVQKVLDRIARIEQQPVDAKQKRRLRDAKKALEMAEDKAGARREELETMARELRAKLGSHDYMTAEQRAAEKAAAAREQQGQVSTEGMKELEEARGRTRKATGPVVRGTPVGETRVGPQEATIETPAGTKITPKEQQQKVAKQERAAGVGQGYAGAISESKTPKEVDRAISNSEMQEANRIAEELRNKPKEKRNKEVEQARKVARELKTLFTLDQDADTDFDADLDNFSATRDSTVYDERPVVRLNDDAMDAARDGRILDLLDNLAQNASTPFARELAKRLRPLVMKTKLRTIDGGVFDEAGNPVEGAFRPKTNTVELSDGALFEETVLHEISHAVTVNQLDADINTLTPEQRQARQELEALLTQVRKDPAFDKQYGRLNSKELVSEVLSNQDFRDRLDKMKPSLLRRIYNAMLRFFGMTPQSVSERAVENAYALFAPSKVSSGNAVASVLRGVFPGSGAKYGSAVPQSVRDTIAPPVASSKLGQKISSAALGFRTLALDRWAPMEYLLKLGVSKGKLSEVQAQQMRIHMRLHEDTNRFAAQSLTNGVVQLQEDNGKRYYGGESSDVNMRTVVRQINEAGEALGNSEARLELWQRWMEINRVERKGLGYDVINTKKPMTAADAREIKNLVNGNAQIKQAFENARETYKQFNRDLMRQAAEAGTLPADVAKNLAEMDYIPFYRVDGDAVVLDGVGSKPFTVGSLLDQPYLKELVGDSRERLPVLDAIVQNTSMLTKMNIRNLQSQDAANLLQQMGMGKVIKGEGPANVLRFKNKGDMYWLKLEPDAFPEGMTPEMLLSGMQGVKAAVPTVLKLAGIPTQMLRATITRMPLYVVRQMIRDPLFAWMTTGGKFTPVVSSIKELTKIRRGLSPTEEKLARSGAISSNVMTGDYQDVARMLRDISIDQKGWNWAMAALDKFAMQADASTRAVLYDAYRKEGMDHVDAMLGAAESMNFSRRGTSSSLFMWSTLVPFFNAQLQGIDALYRAAKGDTIYQKKMDVRNTLLKRGLLMLGATIAYSALMQEDEAYKNATPEERAMNWFVRLPGMEDAIRVPIPFEPGLIFKAIPEAIFNAAYGDDTAKDAMKAIGKQLWMSTPLQLPAAINPVIELATNYSFFTDSPIESQRERAMDSEQRYREGTTELAKMLGKTGIASPIQIEHLVRGYFSSAGILAMSMANYPLRPLVSPDGPERPELKLSQMPLFGPAFQPATGRGAINAAYDDVLRFQRAHQTFNTMVERGNVAEARAYANEFAREIALASTGGAFRQQMGELAKLRRQISASALSPSEKRERLEEIRRYEIQLAQQVRSMSRGS